MRCSYHIWGGNEKETFGPDSAGSETRAELGTFTYDGDGNRVSQTINNVTTYFVGNYY